MGIGTSNLKRIQVALLAAIMLLPVTACNKQGDTTVDTSTETSVESTAITYTFGFTDEPEENSSEYTVDNEDKAQKVITCSHRNLFGIEKVVLFEDRFAAVFDKNTCDKCGCFIRQGNDAIQYIWVSFNNLSGIEAQFNITEDQGKYILDAACQYEESDLIDPNREVKITGFGINGVKESIYADILAGDLEINFSEENHDTHTMYYDVSEETWSEVTTKVYESNNDSDTTGIEITWSLDLIFGQEQQVYEYDGVTYQVQSYNGELCILIYNKSEETKTIGGTRYLQRVNGEDLIDLGRNSREMNYAGVIVKDMPVAKVWSLGHSDQYSPWDRTPDPQFTLYENETFEIAPGESMYVEILVMDFDMYKDGIYRLTFGEAIIYFELEWEMIW
ncbi:MAG: hypothetical protein E7383_09740 [Ruminococcaceae bacterium]|nr:hypothetical protein [Oscillospiraceae bacterium]